MKNKIINLKHKFVKKHIVIITLLLLTILGFSLYDHSYFYLTSNDVIKTYAVTGGSATRLTNKNVVSEYKLLEKKSEQSKVKDFYLVTSETKLGNIRFVMFSFVKTGLFSKFDVTSRRYFNIENINFNDAVKLAETTDFHKMTDLEIKKFLSAKNGLPVDKISVGGGYIDLNASRGVERRNFSPNYSSLVYLHRNSNNGKKLSNGRTSGPDVDYFLEKPYSFDVKLTDVMPYSFMPPLIGNSNGVNNIGANSNGFNPIFYINNNEILYISQSDYTKEVEDENQVSKAIVKNAKEFKLIPNAVMAFNLKTYESRKILDLPHDTVRSRAIRYFVFNKHFYVYFPEFGIKVLNNKGELVEESKFITEKGLEIDGNNLNNNLILEQIVGLRYKEADQTTLKSITAMEITFVGGGIVFSQDISKIYIKLCDTMDCYIDQKSLLE